MAGGLADRYGALICERFGRPLEGLRVAVDCANGALSDIAPTVFERLGASVTAIGVNGGGEINSGCGATDLSLLSHTVREQRLDLGVAFDGDGDRMLAVNGEGREVDGDQTLAVLAVHLNVELVVVTEMTNLGFHRLMDQHGIPVVTTDVGDRYVLEALRREGGVLGGEQSGHLIYLDGHVSGETSRGFPSSLLRTGREQRTTLAQAAAAMPRLPQAKTNVQVRSRELPPALLARASELNGKLAGRARLLVRLSGTEPVVRVLAEAETEEKAAELCGSMAALVERELG